MCVPRQAEVAYDGAIASKGTAAPAPGPSPGRYRPGIERRNRILEGTLRVVADAGTAAVSHRAVADAAGVPLGSTTYYFASKEELLEEALRRFAEEEISQLRRTVGNEEGRPLRKWIEGYIDSVVDQLGGADRYRGLAQYELFLDAGRRGDPSGLARRWTEQFVALIEEIFTAARTGSPAADARLFVALMDGFWVQQLAAPASDPREDLEALLDRFVSLADP